MPRFKILPTDSSYPSAEISALDAGSVLNVVSQLNCHEADVLEDEVYKFSVRLSGSGLWSIYQRGADMVSDTIRPFA